MSPNHGSVFDHQSKKMHHHRADEFDNDILHPKNASIEICNKFHGNNWMNRKKRKPFNLLYVILKEHNHRAMCCYPVLKTHHLWPLRQMKIFEKSKIKPFNQINPEEKKIDCGLPFFNSSSASSRDKFR